MRQLNPHSLSYQEKTLIIRSPRVLVSSESTIEECELCRKSMETNSSVVTSNIFFTSDRWPHPSAPCWADSMETGFFGSNRQVDQRNVCGRDADGDAVEACP